MRKIFRNDALNEKIFSDGFIVIPGFINADELLEIKKAYQTLKPSSGNEKAYSSYESTDLELRKKINGFIRTAIARPLMEFYLDYKPLTGVFISKPPQSKESKIKLHFDSNCVEEEEYESTVLWVPLNDVDQHNGGLQVFKGSHRFMSRVRPFNAHFCYKEYYDFFEKHFMSPVYMKAGDALIFLNRTLHYSDNNHTDSERVSFRIDLIPLEARAVQYFNDKHTPPHHVKVFRIEDNYYERFTRDVSPETSFFYKHDPFTELSADELNRVIGSINPGWTDVLKKYRGIKNVFSSFKSLFRQIK